MKEIRIKIKGYKYYLVIGMFEVYIPMDTILACFISAIKRHAYKDLILERCDLTESDISVHFDRRGTTILTAYFEGRFTLEDNYALLFRVTNKYAREIYYKMRINKNS